MRQQLLNLAPPIMRQLSDDTGLTSVLSVLGRAGAVVTLVEEGRGTIVLTIRAGTTLAPKAAQTRVLLAFEPNPAVVRRAHASLDPAEAAAELEVFERVRRERIAWADLHHEGLASAAVPIFAGAAVAAAMALLGTSTMLDPADEQSGRIAALKQAAENLSVLISGEGGAPAGLAAAGRG